MRRLGNCERSLAKPKARKGRARARDQVSVAAGPTRAGRGKSFFNEDRAGLRSPHACSMRTSGIRSSHRLSVRKQSALAEIQL